VEWVVKRFDLPGALTGTGAVAALVYGLSSAAPRGPEADLADVTAI
jgi:hypothetical protein